MTVRWPAKRGDAGSPTTLSTGTVTATTYGITSDGGADDVVLVEATATTSGLLGSAKWNEIVANTAKVSNATHTGDVTGQTALTIAPTSISGKTLVTPVATDMVLLWDATDSTLKRADVSDFLAAGGVPTAITVANEAADTTSFPLFATAATGDLGPKSNAGLTFNASTADLNSTLIAGIANANLVDKSAAETISGAWTYNAASGNTNLTLQKAAFGNQATVMYRDEAGTLRFIVGINSGTGDPFFLGRYDDAGIWQGSALYIDGITGQVDLRFSGDATKLSVVTGGVNVTGAMEATGAVTGSNLNVANWDTAFGWGNHGAAGYGTLSADQVVSGAWSVPSIINTQNGAYTLVLADAGKTIRKATSTAAITHTIPANGAVAFPIGTLIGWQNDGTVDMTIAITTDTLTGSDGVTGSRTLGPNDAAVIQKVAATEWKYAASVTAGTATALSTGTVTATTYGITSDGAVDDVVLAEATTSLAGLLGAAKWNEIVANTAKVSNATHTGDVTGSVALTIADDAVTNAKLANMAANTVKVNATTGAANPVDLAVGTNTVVGRVSGNIGAFQVASGQLAGGAVTYAKMQNVAANRILGRLSTGGIVTELTGDQVRTLIVPTVADKTASYTLVLTDADDIIRFTGATASKVCTIPANASVAFPIGTMIGITNDGTVSMTVAITTDTLVWGKDNTTGTRTLAPGADCVIMKVAATNWKINGSALVT